METNFKTLTEIRDDTPGLRETGDWKVINVEPRMAWPIRAQSFQFGDHELWLVPITSNAQPGIAVRNAKLSQNDSYAMLYRALSVLSWMTDAGAIVVGRGGGSPLFPQYGTDNPPRFFSQHPLDLTGIPRIEDPRAKLALALMREGRGLNHPAYSFLSFYRVIEVALPKGKDRGPWMNDAIDRMSDHRAINAINELRERYEGDIGVHLRNSGRSAVAHAAGEVVANPDEPADYLRLSRELPIMEALAVDAIETILGTETRSTVFREHLYELEGWKPIFGKDLIQIIANGDEPDPDTKVDIPSVNIRFRLSEAFDCMEGLEPFGWGVIDRKAEVQFRSRNGYARVNLLLDFEQERLNIYHETGIQFEDDGSVKAARTGKQLTEFVHALYCNGELQVWNAEDETLISKCDAFIPVNMMFNAEGAEAELARWEGEIDQRRG